MFTVAKPIQKFYFFRTSTFITVVTVALKFGSPPPHNLFFKSILILYIYLRLPHSVDRLHQGFRLKFLM